MVFTTWHYIPSAVSAFLIILLAIRLRFHKSLAIVMFLSALLGLAGYISSGSIRFYPLDFHVLHSYLGLATLMLSGVLFLDGKRANKMTGKSHCRLGYAAAALAALSLVSGLLLLSGWASQEQETTLEQPLPQEAFRLQAESGKLPELEAKEYQGVQLTPLSQQGNNAIAGTQHIDKANYRLEVTGLVEKNLNMSYEELLALPAYSEVAYMPCVEGWGFPAKWTGFLVTDLLNRSGLKPGASYVSFYSADGYSSGLPLSYLQDNGILMAYGINDVTLPAERGFPLQLVAKSRYGYKWAKWITKIEVTDKEVRGYWESRGYSNSAKVGEYPFG
jgi:DMSO/TMAO reductase YedYZ molybdopterin-dependent catalytic subunit